MRAPLVASRCLQRQWRVQPQYSLNNLVLNVSTVYFSSFHALKRQGGNEDINQSFGPGKSNSLFRFQTTNAKMPMWDLTGLESMDNRRDIQKSSYQKSLEILV